MTVLSLERIAAIRADPTKRTRPVPLDHPRRSLPFLPEDQTQLYYTSAYAKLGRAQRIRYNQLFALRVNEYIMMLERDFVDPVLARLRRRARWHGSEALVEAMDAMRAEEAAHYRAFVELNRQCEPDAYRQSECWFMQLRPYERATLRIMQGSAHLLPFALWIIIAMEESSIGLATSMMRARDTELGPLDPYFLAVHREHAKDEARHIHIDVHMVRACLHTSPGWWRALNARIFLSFMRDMTAPKANGTGARVVRRLVAEFPDLIGLQQEMIEGLVALKHHAGFQRSLFNRQLTPLAFALYDEESALADLGQVIKAYERPTVA
jgi:hypothetical protein